jgi:hypothetical protein
MKVRQHVENVNKMQICSIKIIAIYNELYVSISLMLKIKMLRYLNNTHCIIDIVLCWSINMNYCYCLFYIYFECPFSVTVLRFDWT